MATHDEQRIKHFTLNLFKLLPSPRYAERRTSKVSIFARIVHILRRQRPIHLSKSLYDPRHHTDRLATKIGILPVILIKVRHLERTADVAKKASERAAIDA
jgi:hypothetical protein